MWIKHGKLSLIYELYYLHCFITFHVLLSLLESIAIVKLFLISFVMTSKKLKFSRLNI